MKPTTNARLTLGIAYLHLAMIAITRFKMIKFASDMGNIALTLMDRWRDPFTMGRGLTIYSLFVGHIQVSVQQSLPQLEGALEYAIQAGDRISTVLNFGLMGTLKFFASENLADLEAFLHYGCEEIPNWELDVRGGAMAIAIRQACRALQGKTFINEPLEMMSDEHHNSQLYKSWLKGHVAQSDRPLGMFISPTCSVHYQRHELLRHVSRAANSKEISRLSRVLVKTRANKIQHSMKELRSPRCSCMATIRGLLMLGIMR
jgi:hypothetical protein